MRCTTHELDPGNLYHWYVRDLILAARCDDRNARHVFLQRYAPQLSGLTGYVGLLSEDEQQAAFHDALRARDGGWPQSLVGFRLAIPRWFVRRIHDPFGCWKANAGYLPSSFAVDPVCGMLVDPAQTPYVSAKNGVDLYFCCSHCLRLSQRGFDREPLPVAG
jgi:YHS domain-containing protein